MGPRLRGDGTDVSSLFAAVGSGAREAPAQCFEERCRENQGDYNQRDVWRVYEREARGCEQCDGDEQAENARCVVAQDCQCVVELVGPQQQNFHALVPRKLRHDCTHNIPGGM